MTDRHIDYDQDREHPEGETYTERMRQASKLVINGIIAIILLYVVLLFAKLIPEVSHEDHSADPAAAQREDDDHGAADAHEPPAPEHAESADAHEPAEHGPSGHGDEPFQPHYWAVIPFAALLLCIAILPLLRFTEHWWHHNKNRFLVAASLGAITLIYYGVVHPGGIANHFTGAHGTAEDKADKTIHGWLKGTGVWQALDQACAFVSCQMQADDEDDAFVGISSFGGGGLGGWCTDLQDKLGSDYFKDLQKDAGYSQSVPILNIRESIVWSTACTCLPGIVYNMDKLRQIYCRKAVCLDRDVPEAGVPISYCNDEHDYLTCKFWWGELFRALPFSAVYDQMIDILVEAWASPYLLVSTAIGVACSPFCGKDQGEEFHWCVVPKTIVKVLDGVRSVQNFHESYSDSEYWDVSTTWCAEMEDLD